MLKATVLKKMPLVTLATSFAIIFGISAQAGVRVPAQPGMECMQGVCANYVETPEQEVFVNIVVLPNAPGRLRPRSYGIWAVALVNGREFVRAPVQENRVGSHSQLLMGPRFSGPFEIYFTDFKGHYYSNFGKNFHFEIPAP